VHALAGTCPRDFYDLSRDDAPRPDEDERCHVYLYSYEHGPVYAQATFIAGEFVDRETTQPGDHVIQDFNAYVPLGWRPFEHDRARYAERFGPLP
jgi:hypothetical protein